jgi:hypothetical protein
LEKPPLTSTSIHYQPLPPQKPAQRISCPACAGRTRGARKNQSQHSSHKLGLFWSAGKLLRGQNTNIPKEMQSSSAKGIPLPCASIPPPPPHRPLSTGPYSGQVCPYWTSVTHGAKGRRS